MIKQANNHGFSFIELILTLTFLAIVLSPLYNFLINVGNYSADHITRSEGLTIASNILEQAAAEPFEKLYPAPLAPQHLDRDFTFTTEVRYLDTDSITQIVGPSPFKQILVKVSWENSYAATENIILSKVISK